MTYPVPQPAPAPYPPPRANISVTSCPRLRIELGLSGYEAQALCDSITEAASYVDNWRSDPRFLLQLRDEIVKALRGAGT